MLLSTTNTVAERQVVKTLGVVQGSIIRSKNMFVDIGAGLRSIVGGEVRGYSQMISEAREEAAQRMIKQAEELGADAVVGLRFTSSTVMGGASEILAYGTAVTLG